MPFNGSGTHEELRSDLGVGQSVLSQQRDLSLLRGQIVARLGYSLSSSRTRRKQFPVSSLSKAPHSHDGEHFERDSQLAPRVHSPPLSAQPLSVEQVRPC